MPSPPGRDATRAAEPMAVDPSVPDGWDDSNRAFLQALMGRGALTFQEAQHIVAAILSAGDAAQEVVNPRDVSEDLVRHYISRAREAVAALDYDIRSTLHQTTRERIWAFVNAHSDPATQLATTRTADELAFIKRLLDAMFDTYNTPRQEVMAVTAAQARKVARPPQPPRREEGQGGGDAEGAASQPQRAAAARGLKHSEIEKLLPSMVGEGWLELSRAGFYSLSARSLMELKTWLQDAYNDPEAAPGDWQRIKFCEACKDIVTMGQRCPERDCNARLHDICADAFWRTRRGGHKICPRCETPWTGRNFVGERSVTETPAAHRRVGRASGPRVRDEDVSIDPEEADEGD